MKLALFSTLLLSLSTFRVAAMPNIVSKDTRDDNYRAARLPVRSTRDVAAANLDPITASVVFSLTTSAIALAVHALLNEVSSSRTTEASLQVMSAYADQFSSDHPEYSGGVLLVEDGAILGFPNLDYTEAAVEFVDTSDPQVYTSTYCVTVVSVNAGSLVVDGALHDGKETLWQIRGNIAVDLIYYDPNAIVPNEAIQFTWRG
ncbi:hypothetical protein LshimejAT787_0200500 [Lyophyllum shimeji]|uniref:Uncharacterized protein n=1 Tax=Lyophyllum shimeji TaxID=47721 RepID=A0A9P3PEJ3_LYOSH|nr:hypothetical protein LshimejAT787_0200500 [Lyophyllum shimeji]